MPDKIYDNNKPKLKAYAVLLAGGTGTRLWPLSRRKHPKQLINFFDDDSFIQKTIKRVIPVIGNDNIKIVCGHEHCDEISRHMKDIDIEPVDKIISEPCGKNTAPAILYAILKILKEQKDAIICVFAADHIINNPKEFHNKLKSAIILAKKDYIVTFGIKPNYPETGYGYIEGDLKKTNNNLLNKNLIDDAQFVKRFVEKPDSKTAKKYIKAGNFYWNSGMFAFKASAVISEFKKHVPDLYKSMDQKLKKSDEISNSDYKKLPDISIDYAVMEKTKNCVVLPSDFAWNDIGSWKSVYDINKKDEKNNVIKGNVIAQNTSNCLIMGENRLIATNNIKDIAIIETSDAVFVSDIENSRDVKSIAQKLESQNKKEFFKHNTTYHIWGKKTELDSLNNKVEIYPNSIYELTQPINTISHVIIADGAAQIIEDNNSEMLKKGQSKILNKNQKVIIKNTSSKSIKLIHIILEV